MKKLLTTVIGAAVAIGAFAIETGVRFESAMRGTNTIAQLNAAAGESADYWRGDELTNVYEVVAMDSYTGTRPAYFVAQATSTNALSVKTTFGKPLSFKVNDGGDPQTIGNTGIYFDSLVKFTVCEEPPEDNLYSDAKIVMWLQEQYDSSDNVTGTNLMVRAGYLTYDNGVAVSNAVYALGTFGTADEWHRVTIKTIANITTAAAAVPGFAIYIDGSLKSTLEEKWDSTFTGQFTLSEVARNLNDQGGLFPSLVQSGAKKGSLEMAQFDGTGEINELFFTATAPSFADDEEYLDEKFSVAVPGAEQPKSIKTIDALVTYVNGLTTQSGDCTITLTRGINFAGPLEFNNANRYLNLILDLNGLAITNTAETGYALVLQSPLTITDSSEAKTGAIVSDIAGEGNGAIYVNDSAGGSLELFAGTIDGAIDWAEDAAVILYGGTVKQDPDGLTADGVIGVARGATGFYDIVPAFTVTLDPANGGAVTTINNVPTNTLASALEGLVDPTWAGHTFTGWSPDPDETVIVSNTTFTAQWTVDSVLIRFISGEGTVTNDYNKAIGETVVAPEAVAVTGKSFKEWSPAVVSPVAAAAEYNAVYTANVYTVTFVIGESSSTIQKNYGSEIVAGEVPVPSVIPGYTGAWDTNPVGQTVSGDVTYTYTRTVNTYTITFVNEKGDDPAAINYTIVSGEIALPEATTATAVLGIKYAGWTNDTITVAITNFTPAAGNLANFTLYAKWDVVAPTTPVIPVDASTVEVTGDGSEDATTVAEGVNVAKPAGATVDDATYQGYFTKTAEYNTDTGKWTVTAEISDTVQSGVETAAVAVLDGTASTVTVPSGLYYKVTTYTAIGGAKTVVDSGLSNGTAISVTKPGTTAGFIEVELGTVAP